MATVFIDYFACFRFVYSLLFAYMYFVSYMVFVCFLAFQSPANHDACRYYNVGSVLVDPVPQILAAIVKAELTLPFASAEVCRRLITPR